MKRSLAPAHPSRNSGSPTGQLSGLTSKTSGRSGRNFVEATQTRHSGTLRTLVLTLNSAEIVPDEQVEPDAQIGKLEEEIKNLIAGIKASDSVRFASAMASAAEFDYLIASMADVENIGRLQSMTIPLGTQWFPIRNVAAAAKTIPSRSNR